MSLQQFVGCYYGKEKTKGYYNSTEEGKLKISLDNDNNLTFLTCGRTIYENGNASEQEKHKTIFNISADNEDYVNYQDDKKEEIIKCNLLGNKITCEYEYVGLFGGRTNNAQTFILHKDKCIRNVFMNYSWKSPFGNYWFSNTYTKHIFTKVDDIECSNID